MHNSLSNFDLLVKQVITCFCVAFDETENILVMLVVKINNAVIGPCHLSSHFGCYVGTPMYLERTSPQSHANPNEDK